MGRSYARCNELRLCTCCTTSTTPDHVAGANCLRIMALLHLLQKPDAHKHKLMRLNHLVQSHTTYEHFITVLNPTSTPLFQPTSCQCALISRIMSNFSRKIKGLGHSKVTQRQRSSLKRHTSGIAAYLQNRYINDKPQNLLRYLISLKNSL